MTTLFKKISLGIVCITSASLLVIGSSSAQSIQKVRKANVASPVTDDVPTGPNVSSPSCFRPNPLRGLFDKNQVYGIFRHQGWLYVPFVADREHTYILRIRPADTPQNEEDIHVLREINGRPIQHLRAADVKGDSLVFWTKDQRLVLQDETWRMMPNPEPELYRHSGRVSAEAGMNIAKFWMPLAWVWQWIAEPSPGHRLLIWGERTSLHSHRGPDRPGIAVLTTQTGNKARRPKGARPLFHPLPQPSMQQYKKLSTGGRSSRSRYLFNLEVNFGVYDVHEGKVWFGLTFYDSEGISGVGGYGRFDPATGEYDVTWGKPAADLSVLALYHAGDALWMGLTSRHESVSLYQGGIARVDLSDNSVRRYEVPGAVDVLCPVENTLWIGSREGLFQMNGDTVETVWPLRDDD